MPRNHREWPEPPNSKLTEIPGLWVISLASLVGMFAVASILRGPLGDFWSLAAFLPIWATFYLVIHIFRTLMEGRHDRE